MGFYAPAQLVREARRQGVEVRPADVCSSDWDCRLETAPDGSPALRLGLRMIKGLSRAGAEQLVAARRERPWSSLVDLDERVGLTRKDLKALAGADALSSLTGNRHLAAWQVCGLGDGLPLAPVRSDLGDPGQLPLLPVPTEGAQIVADYRSLGLTLRRHPLALLRPRLEQRRLLSAREIAEATPGSRVRTCGLVINRQRPASAKDVTFVTLEDETGYINLVVWPDLAERQRAVLLGARLLSVAGEVQRESGVTHLIARRLGDDSELLGGLLARSRDFH
jgi:error-prone DNA polymerase